MSNSIPAGLIDDNVEIFSTNIGVKATHNGIVKDISMLPAPFLMQIETALLEKPSAVFALKLAGYETPEARLHKYAECRFGGFNKSPDIIEGTITGYEYWDCGHRGTCAFEGVVCGFVKRDGKIYTPFEIQLINRLCTEETLPVIAEKMNICLNTLDKRKKELFQKMAVLSRARLVAKSYELEII